MSPPEITMLRVDARHGGFEKVVMGDDRRKESYLKMKKDPFLP
jgi:hypothetical protein